MQKWNAKPKTKLPTSQSLWTLKTKSLTSFMYLKKREHKTSFLEILDIQSSQYLNTIHLPSGKFLSILQFNNSIIKTICYTKWLRRCFKTREVPQSWNKLMGKESVNFPKGGMKHGWGANIGLLTAKVTSIKLHGIAMAMFGNNLGVGKWSRISVKRIESTKSMLEEKIRFYSSVKWGKWKCTGKRGRRFGFQMGISKWLIAD